MKKQNPLILEIPKPCTESWAEMTPMGLGRFCMHCQKTVTDITQMNDEQVLQLFQKNKDTHCIRAFASQLNRPISLPAQEPTRFYRIAVALGLTLVMAAGADAYARPSPPLVEQNYLLNEGDTTKNGNPNGDKLAIRGEVLDENGQPMVGINLLLDDGTNYYSDENGRFEFSLNINQIQNATINLMAISTYAEIYAVLFDKTYYIKNAKLKFNVSCDYVVTGGTEY